MASNRNGTARGMRDPFARDMDKRRIQNQRRQRFGRSHHGLHTGEVISLTEGSEKETEASKGFGLRKF